MEFPTAASESDRESARSGEGNVRHTRVLILVAMLGAATLAAGVSTAQARTTDRAKPIIYVHGFLLSGASNCNQWQPMAATLASLGHTGPQTTLAYYTGDANCSHALDHHGSHDLHHPSGHRDGSHTQATSIRHLGYHLAWMIYDHYTLNGRPVDIVAHSMGGLAVRYALAQTQHRHHEFPPRLLVEDIVTLGTPHAGTTWARSCSATQCAEMVPGSRLLAWLADNAQNPQGADGSDWTTVGSYYDAIVSANSAVAMAAAHQTQYLPGMRIEHSDYYTDTSGAQNADVRYRNAPSSWRYWFSGPHVVRWADKALVEPGW
jgi:triacylglycerol esterase/lipase EstA (alpha/beta hydrolase family)